MHRYVKRISYCIMTEEEELMEVEQLAQLELQEIEDNMI